MILGVAAPGLVNANIILSTDMTETYGNLFSSIANIDALHITSMSEPATIVLLGLGSLVLIGRRRKWNAARGSLRL